LRLLAEEDPQIDIMARRPQKWEFVNLTPPEQAQMYGVPDLTNIRFRTRTLIEGLIGLGTIKPGDVPALLRAVQRQGMVPAFQERLLESMFMMKEDRIADIEKFAAGQLFRPVGKGLQLTSQEKHDG
jgi:RNA-dependent RNA polymerase